MPTLTQAREELAAPAEATGIWATPGAQGLALGRRGCGAGGVGERVPALARQPSRKWLQNSADAGAFRLRKSSAGSEGKAQERKHLQG